MIYFDNAASSMPDPEVVSIMNEVLINFWGNPSSTHFFGSEAKELLEASRINIANTLNCKPEEIIFTSGGTEAINTIFYNVSKMENINKIITSPLEHPAVLNSINQFELENKTIFVKIDKNLNVDYNHLESLLSSNPSSIVCLMHVHNESGVVLDVEKVSTLCKKYNSLFFCDTVASMGKLEIDLTNSGIDLACCSGHKLHATRGIGFLYKKNNLDLIPLHTGGGQEFGLRSGTENLPAIVGLAKAFEIAYDNLESNTLKIYSLKEYLKNSLKNIFPNIKIIAEETETIYSTLTLALPINLSNSKLIYELSENEIAISSGSACHDGQKPSVMMELTELKEYISIRISLSKFNTQKEIDYFIGIFSELYS